MTTFDFSRICGIFGNSDSNSNSKKRAQKQRQGRTCRIEELEGREMLSVTPWSLADDAFAHCEPPETASPTLQITESVLSDSPAPHELMPLSNTLLDEGEFRAAPGANSVTLSVAVETLDDIGVSAGMLAVMFRPTPTGEEGEVEVPWALWDEWFDWDWWAPSEGDASIEVTHLADGDYDFRLMTYWGVEERVTLAEITNVSVTQATAPVATPYNPFVVHADFAMSGFDLELWWDAIPDTAYRVTCISHTEVFEPVVVLSVDGFWQGAYYCEAYARFGSESLVPDETYEFSVVAINANGVTGPGNPTIAIIVIPDDSVPDIGSSIGTAESVEFDEDDVYTVTQNIRYDGVHMYKIDVLPEDVGMKYTFTTSKPEGTTMEFDTYIRLFDAYGRQLGYNDDISSSNRYSELDYTFDVPGSYYLGVCRYSAHNYNPNESTPGTSLAIGMYTLTVTMEAQPLGGVSVSTDSPKVNTAITATLSPDDATATYQWFRGEIAITGATSHTYIPVLDDVGYKLKIVATGTGIYAGTVEYVLDKAVTTELVFISTSTDSPKVNTPIAVTALLPEGAGIYATYQWYRGDNPTPIATGSSYTPVLADVGFFLKVVAAGIGSYTGEVEHTLSNVVTAELTGVTIDTNSPQVGEEITATLLPGGATANYQWFRGEITIAGATSRTYIPVLDDVGHTLWVRATGTETGNYTGAVSSLPTGVVKAKLTSIIINNDSPEVGTPLTTTLFPGGADATYQWYRDGVAIPGATLSSYTPGLGDVGFFLKVVATGNDNYINAVEATLTSVVTAALTGLTIDNAAPQVGKTINAVLSPNGATATYQWFRDGVAITDATESSSYTVTAADLGARLHVVAAGTETGNYTGTFTSSPTNVVTTNLTSIDTDTDLPAVGTRITTTLLPVGATVDYQWYRGTTSGNVTTPISGAAFSSYTPVLADVGCYLKVVATGTDNYTGEVSYTLTNAVPRITLTGITIDNNVPKKGDVITATLAPGNATATYQWFRNGEEITGATESSYTVTAADEGCILRVEAVGTDKFIGEVNTLTNPVKITLESITVSTELPQVDALITTTLLPVGATVDYQWYRGNDPISGATSSSYTPVLADVGYKLKIVATGKDNYTGMVEHILTSVVKAELTGILLSTDSPQVDAPITATLLPNGATADYQWYRGTTPITGATEISYTPDVDDVGYVLKIVVTGTGNYTGAQGIETLAAVVNVDANILKSITINEDSPQVGNTITTTLEPGGADATYKWYRDETLIEGAIFDTYTVVLADLGHYLRVDATGSGSYTGTVRHSSTSAVTDKLTAVSVNNDSPKVGDTVTVTSLEPAGATATYQWFRGDDPAPIAAGSSYTVTADDEGYVLRVAAAGTNNYTETVWHTLTNPVKITLKSITVDIDSPQVGSPKVGDKITAALLPGDAAADYQWYRDGEEIIGATGSFYTVTAGDEGCFLHVVAAGTGNYTGTVEGTLTSAVKITLKSISISTNSPVVGTPITATPVPEGATVNYQWYRDGEEIEGATSRTYRPVLADVGYKLKIVATGTESYTGSVEHTLTNAVPKVTLTDVTIDNNSPQVGDEITATLEPGGANETATYQWYRGTTAITGAVENTYTPVLADVGYTLWVSVTGNGKYTGDVSSLPTNLVKAELTGITVSTDSPKVGDAVTVTLEPGGADATYQWYRSTTSSDVTTLIDGAVSRTYTPGLDDVGCFLKVVVTGSGNYSGTESRTLTNTVPMVTLTGVTIDKNSPQVGDVITATLLPGGATANYQWYRGTTLITGAVGSSYEVTTADLGAQLRVAVTGTGGYTGEVNHTPTSAVTAQLVSIETSTESPKVGALITTTLLPEGATVTYLWYHDGIPIHGATSSSYTPTLTDVGAVLKVVATCTGNYTGEVEHILPDKVTAALTSITVDKDSPLVGDVITAALVPGSATATYQWFRDGKEIEGATESSYTVTAADKGCVLKVVAVGSGYYTGDVSSSPTGAVTNVQYPLTGITVDTNVPQVGNKITATLSPGGATVDYQWYRDGKEIEGATESTYTPVVADVGCVLKVVATGTGSYTGEVERILFNAVKIALEGISTTTDVPQVGKEITATLSPGDADVTYQWYRGTTVITGAASSSYTPTYADVGHFLKVAAIGKGNYTGTVEYALLNMLTVELTSITVDKDSPLAGDVITAALVPGSATATYQWYRDGKEIEGATESSYTVTAADEGCVLKVVAAGTDGYTGEVEYTLTSAVKITLTSITVDKDSPLVGDVITAALVPDSATVTYQWYRDGKDIEGATESTYTPVAADVGCVLKVVAVGTDGYTGEVECTLTNAVVDNVLPQPNKGGGNDGALTKTELKGASDSTAAIKGQKNLSKNATIVSITFEWNTAKMGTTLDKVEKVEFFVIGPKPKGGTAPVVTSFVLDWEEITEQVASGSWTGTAAGGYKITVTKNGSSPYNITISGLNAGTKYSIQMRAVETGGKKAKGVTISASTKKYAVPQKGAKAVSDTGKVTLNWKAAKGLSTTAAVKGYEVGVFVGKECLFGDELGAYLAKEGITLPQPVGKVTTITVTGLASQKYTFGVREIAEVNGFEAKSAIRKITAAPKKYVAPKVNEKPGNVKPGLSASFTWHAVQSPPAEAISYEVGIWDAVKKEYLWFSESVLSYDKVEIKKKQEVAVGVSIDSFPLTTADGLTTAMLDKGKYTFGVREVVSVGGNVIAKSATLKVSVTVK